MKTHGLEMSAGDMHGKLFLTVAKNATTTFG